MRFNPSVPFLFLVEGAQGVGKTSLTNKLREEVVHTQLFRLSGCGVDNSHKSFDNHSKVLNFLMDTSKNGLNAVLDRSYLSEIVYSRLYRDDLVTERREPLDLQLEALATQYNLISILLVADRVAFANRLQRDKPDYDSGVQFTVDTSIEQQRLYMQEFTRLSKGTLGKRSEIYLIETSERSTEAICETIIGNLGGALAKKEGRK